MLEFDVFVIGTGPAGQRAAIQAAKLGKKVGICERRVEVGGLCTHAGVIASKTFREAILYLAGFQERLQYGQAFSVKQEITMDDLLLRCRNVVKHEMDVMRHQLNRNGLHVVSGEASFLDPKSLVVRGDPGPVWVKADHIVIVTGTAPGKPEGVEVDGTTITRPMMCWDWNRSHVR